jgi:hypothetical protein
MKSTVEYKLFPLLDMKTTKRHCRLNACTAGFMKPATLLLTLLVTGLLPVRAADIGKTYATPEEAVTALMKATRAESGSELRAIFGPAAAEIQNPDRVQATNEFKAFTAALNETNRLVRESETNYVLEVGTNNWPFPVPIAKKDGRWFFYTEAGVDEIENRRIGKNELATLETVRAYVGAQREYASRDRMGDEVLQYAQHVASTPGTKDGLYWPEDLDGELSPLGPMVADAQEEGYKMEAKGQASTRLPFHGYYFKILTRQGKNAPGGKYDYIINGRMIGGFALVAWPADYEDSGIMTFIVNQQGRVYQKDLGPKTEKLAPAMKAYDPDPTWTVSQE